MDPHKRQGSEHVSPRHSKSARTENTGSRPDEIQDPGNLPGGPEMFGDFQIRIKQGSSTKAARNDPKPLTDYHEPPPVVSAEQSNEQGNDNYDHNDDSRGQRHRALDIEEDEDNDDSLDEDHNKSQDDFPQFRWLEQIYVTATRLADLDKPERPIPIAYCHAMLIRRDQIRNVFYQEMEAAHREAMMLAFELFDRYGRLKPEFKDHPIIKGSGVWGEELDNGDMLLIEKVFVDKDFRRQGLGRKMTESLLKFAHGKTRSYFAFTWPTVLQQSDIREEYSSLQDQSAKDEMWDREYNRAVAFDRSLGFRRVGSSRWFAMTFDDEHSACRLPVTDDFDPLESLGTSLHPLLTVLPQVRGSPEFLATLRECLRQKGSVDDCWKSQDENGNTVLHLSATAFNVDCIQWIMEQEFGNQLLGRRNNNGETPLELVQFQLERTRTQRSYGLMRTLPISDEFRGHHDRAVRCLLLLKGQGSVESFVEKHGEDALQQISRGCTCGSCLEGVISPRMKLALKCQAEIIHDMMNTMFGQWSGHDWVDIQSEFLTYLRRDVTTNLATNKSMRQGFINLYLHIATCLKEKMMPTTFNVLEIVEEEGEWPPHTKAYLRRGGTVAAVFLALCQCTKEQAVWADDASFLKLFGEDISSIPRCRNDLEFGFVSGMCGYDPKEYGRTGDGNLWFP